MTLEELQEGLKQLQAMQPEIPSDAPWSLSRDNYAKTYGKYVSNDEGLINMLFNEMEARGVDTAAAERALSYQLLGQLVGDLNLLQGRLASFIAEVQQNINKATEVSSVIQETLDAENTSAEAQKFDTEALRMNDLEPGFGAAGDMPAGGTPAGDMPAGDMPAGDMPPSDMPAGDMPPSDMPAGDMPAGGMPPSDMPAGDMPAGDMPPSDTPAGDMPAGDTPAVPKPNSEPTGSDRRIKYILSDASMKNICSKITKSKSKKAPRISAAILDACRGGML